MRFVCKPATLLAGAMLVAMATVARPVSAQGVLEACEEEIEVLCPKVSPGHGRVIACMYAHENYLNESCANAIADLGDMLDYVFTTVRGALAVCAGDIETQCAGTQFGGGRLLTCLTEKQADVSSDCNAAVAEFKAQLLAD